jgi:hypothetical protein
VALKNMSDDETKKLPKSLVEETGELLYQYLIAVHFLHGSPKAFALRLASCFFASYKPQNSLLVTNRAAEGGIEEESNTRQNMFL